MTAERLLFSLNSRLSGVPEVNNLDLDEYTTIVDAIFGVGLSSPVEGNYAELSSMR